MFCTSDMFKMESSLKKTISKCAGKSSSLTRQNASKKRVKFAGQKENELELEPIRNQINKKFLDAKHEILLLDYTGDFSGFTENRQRELKELGDLVKHHINQKSNNGKSLANSDKFAEKPKAMGQSRLEIPETLEINKTGCQTQTEALGPTQQHIVIEENAVATLSDAGPQSITIRCLEGDFNVVVCHATMDGSFLVLSVTSAEAGSN